MDHGSPITDHRSPITDHRCLPTNRQQPAMPLPAILLMGPTASGKSAVALELARRFDVEIVSVDSAQVYRGMDIGTAKPDARARRAVPHHLIDILDPVETYSAARFADEAWQLIREISARGRVPLLAGGTMLYFKALREGLSALPAADPDVRLVIDTMAADIGWPALHASLAKLDPETAARLDPADTQRIQRALEICWLTGRAMSEVIAAGRAAPPPHPIIAISLEPSDRSQLHARIATRFEEMLELGLLGELRRLKDNFALGPEMPSMRCVGYRQAWGYLAGDYGLATLREKAVAATRQLAKRQLTWLRSMPVAERFDCLADALEDRVAAFVGERLEGDEPR
jgi:tRNA dimethylallyltransferase